MSDPLRDLAPGDEIPTSVRTWNALLANARESRRESSRIPITPELEFSREPDIVKVKNVTTGVTFEYGDIAFISGLELPEPSVHPSVDLLRYRRTRPVLRISNRIFNDYGVPWFPIEATRRAVAILEPIPPGQIGEAVVSGLAVVRYNTNNNSPAQCVVAVVPSGANQKPFLQPMHFGLPIRYSEGPVNGNMALIDMSPQLPPRWARLVFQSPTATTNWSGTLNAFGNFVPHNLDGAIINDGDGWRVDRRREFLFWVGGYANITYSSLGTDRITPGVSASISVNTGGGTGFSIPPLTLGSQSGSYSHPFGSGFSRTWVNAGQKIQMGASTQIHPQGSGTAQVFISAVMMIMETAATEFMFGAFSPSGSSPSLGDGAFGSLDVTNQLGDSFSASADVEVSVIPD